MFVNALWGIGRVSVFMKLYLYPMIFEEQYRIDSVLLSITLWNNTFAKY